jgi:hypothetical protein
VNFPSEPNLCPVAVVLVVTGSAREKKRGHSGFVRSRAVAPSEFSLIWTDPAVSFLVYI